MRALVISDTHFGTWTGDDLLRRRDELELLEPYLNDVDEVVFLGDLFDLLFARREDAFYASEPFLDMLRDKLQNKRLVFVAGNHDHHVVAREGEAIYEVQLATGDPIEAVRARVRGNSFFRQFLERRLEGVEVELCYPTYMVGDVLCTHGHYLDPHARRTGSFGARLLGHAIWSIALGQRADPRTIAEYEALITLLTEELYTLAQVPHGTAIQRKVYAAAQRLTHTVSALETPVKLLKQRGMRIGARARGRSDDAVTTSAAMGSNFRHARLYQRRRETSDVSAAQFVSYPLGRVVRPSDPRGQALAAFSTVVQTLGWDNLSNKIVFAHTHQPLDGVTVPGSSIRYWNTGSWLYEPNLASREAYVDYLRRAWPGTVVLIDTDADNTPRLLRLRDHLNPLQRPDPGSP